MGVINESNMDDYINSVPSTIKGRTYKAWIIDEKDQMKPEEKIEKAYCEYQAWPDPPRRRFQPIRRVLRFLINRLPTVRQLKDELAHTTEELACERRAVIGAIENSDQLHTTIEQLREERDQARCQEVKAHGVEVKRLLAQLGKLRTKNHEQESREKELRDLLYCRTVDLRQATADRDGAWNSLQQVKDQRDKTWRWLEEITEARDEMVDRAVQILQECDEAKQNHTDALAWNALVVQERDALRVERDQAIKDRDKLQETLSSSLYRPVVDAEKYDAVVAERDHLIEESRLATIAYNLLVKKFQDACDKRDYFARDVKILEGQRNEALECARDFDKQCNVLDGYNKQANSEMDRMKKMIADLEGERDKLKHEDIPYLRKARDSRIIELKKARAAETKFHDDLRKAVGVLEHSIGISPRVVEGPLGFKNQVGLITRLHDVAGVLRTLSEAGKCVEGKSEQEKRFAIALENCRHYAQQSLGISGQSSFHRQQCRNIIREVNDQYPFVSVNQQEDEL